MHYIALDTNTWIYLANGFEPARILSFLKDEIEKGNIRILLPCTVIDEWNRNKDRTVKEDTLKHYREIKASLDRMLKLMGEKGKRTRFSFLIDEKPEPHDSDPFEELIKKFSGKKKEIEDSLTANIDLIDKLFEHATTIKIEISDAVKLRAGESALKKKAPFGEKNSFADALIIFSFIEYVKANKLEGTSFVTCNTSDFCVKEQGKHRLHPDFVNDFKETKSAFEHIVSKVINAIEKDIVSAEELAWIEEQQAEYEADRRAYCRVCLGRDDVVNGLSSVGSIECIDESTDLKYNPAQYEFEFAKEFPKRIRDLVPVATCDHCHSDHYACPRCMEMNPVLVEDYGTMRECMGCGQHYLIDTTGDHENIGEDYLYRIIQSLEVCEKCGREYERDGSGNNICQKCEDEYAYS